MSVQENKLKAIADAIRAAEGSTAPIPAAEFAARIEALKLPALSNPGSANDLLEGKQLIDANGNILTGSMPKVTQATPGITVSPDGLITASSTQGAGYVAEGTKSATKQLTTQAAATITPGTAAKTAVAAGRYTTGAVTVAGDSNLVAANIKSGVSIYGINGTHIGSVSLPEDYRLENGVITGSTSSKITFTAYASPTYRTVCGVYLLATVSVSSLASTNSGHIIINFTLLKGAQSNYSPLICPPIYWDKSAKTISLGTGLIETTSSKYINFSYSVNSLTGEASCTISLPTSSGYTFPTTSNSSGIKCGLLEMSKT